MRGPRSIFVESHCAACPNVPCSKPDVVWSIARFLGSGIHSMEVFLDTTDRRATDPAPSNVAYGSNLSRFRISAARLLYPLKPDVARRGGTAEVPLSAVSRCSKQKRYSITSSARASSVDGTLRPSALAVLRLITSSYLVGACTGRSAGFSPFRMRST